MATVSTPFLELFAAHNPKREGRSYKMLCPFHADERPSLSIDPEKGLWQCFGCGESGDAITFLQRSRGLEFGEAADLWREMSGEEPKHSRSTRGQQSGQASGQAREQRKVRVIPMGDPADGKPKTGNEPPRAAKQAPLGYSGPARERVSSLGPKLMERMAELYGKALAKSPEALEYLAKRGLTDLGMLRAFRLGFVDGSVGELGATKEHREALRELGLLNERGTETLYGCVVAPLTNGDGAVTGFFARRIRPSSNPHRSIPGLKGEAKLFHVQAAENGELVLVEGFLDALACYQAGVRNVMAIGGAASFEPGLLELIASRGVKEVLLALDPDDAGDAGSKRWAEELERRGVGSKRVRLDVDPNEFFRTGGTVEGFRAKAEDGETLGKPSTEAELLFQTGGVLFRARACGGPGSKSGKLRVHLLLSFAPRLQGSTNPSLPSAGHRDTLDLYSHKARKVFANCFFEKCRSEFGDDGPTLPIIESGLEDLINKLERRADQKAEARANREAPAMSPQEREAATAFLSEPGLRERLQDDMNSLGYVGEKEAKLLVYLIATSRKLPRPLSGIIGSGSGAGKSFLAELAEVLMPPEDVELFSKLTPQALYYLPEDYLYRKLLMLEERAGGEGADYAIRTLQSKDKLTQLVTMKDPLTGNSSTRQFTVRGPIAYLETTTESYLNPENTSRCFEIPLDESAEQTRKIHEHQRRARSFEGLSVVVGREALKRRHHNAQRLLESVRVVIPYAEELTFPDRYLRTRRDHERFLSLIEVVAFLHQFQRVRKEAVIRGETVSYIEATPEDYEIAYELALKVLWVSLDELSRWGRELLDILRGQAEEVMSEGCLLADLTWTRRQLRESLNWPDRRLRECLDELVSLEHLDTVGGSKGKTFIYTLNPNLSTTKRALGLLTPEQLREKLGLTSSQVCGPQDGLRSSLAEGRQGSLTV